MPSGRWLLAAVPVALVVRAARPGGGIGGLLNATFGNAAELPESS